MFKKALNLIKRDLLYNAENIIIAFLVFAIFDLVFGTVCITKLLVGIPCPFCGLTRAGLNIISLDFIEAYKLNPLIYYVAILFILWFINRYFGIFSKKLVIAMLIILVIISIPVYIFRFFAIYPNSEPMTYFNNNLLKVVINFIHKFTGG